MVVKIGHGIRVLGAFATLVQGMRTGQELYRDFSNEVLSKALPEMGRRGTEAVDGFFGLYGFGELVAVVQDYARERKEDYRANIVNHTGRVLRVAPMLAPVISDLTDGDFFKSVVAPAAACIVGWGLEYGSSLRKASTQDYGRTHRHGR